MVSYGVIRIKYYTECSIILVFYITLLHPMGTYMLFTATQTNTSQHPFGCLTRVCGNMGIVHSFQGTVEQRSNEGNKDTIGKQGEIEQDTPFGLIICLSYIHVQKNTLSLWSDPSKHLKAGRDRPASETPFDSGPRLLALICMCSYIKHSSTPLSMCKQRRLWQGCACVQTRHGLR